jgi:hypothetical protein
MELNVTPGIYIWTEPKDVATRIVVKDTVDIVMSLYE